MHSSSSGGGGGGGGVPASSYMLLNASVPLDPICVAHLLPTKETWASLLHGPVVMGEVAS